MFYEFSNLAGEERCEAARLEPWGRPILRDARLRYASADSSGRGGSIAVRLRILPFRRGIGGTPCAIDSLRRMGPRRRGDDRT